MDIRSWRQSACQKSARVEMPRTGPPLTSLCVTLLTPDSHVGKVHTQSIHSGNEQITAVNTTIINFFYGTHRRDIVLETER